MKELSERKRKILHAVVDLYISTGEPVSSADVQSKYLPDVSSATIRAELSALEKRALFIPLPKGVSRGDQLDNAVYAKTLGGRVLYESELKGLVREIDKTLSLPPMTKPTCDTNGKIVGIIRDSISRGDLCKNKKL